MLRVAFAIAVATAAFTCASDTTKAAPGAPLPAGITGSDITPVHYYHGRYYRYRWHGHYYHHRYWRHHRWYYY